MSDMFNIPFPTMGGNVWWDTLVSRGGYKLQQHKITGHARILDSNDIRVAWGDLDTMARKMDIIAGSRHDNSYNAPSSGSSGDNGSLDAMEQLKKLKELLDIGAITQAEFDRKKADLMSRI